LSGLPDIYDALAPHYREYAGRRAAYLAAVDRFVLENLPTGADSLLDVGAGDGVRAMALARAGGIRRVVLCDSSSEMAARCRSLAPAEVWELPAEALPVAAGCFDVIFCLWNVLGHLENGAARAVALDRMKALLAERGVIFLDVNNRHNAAAYGWVRVAGRAVIDFLRPDERRGDASYEWRIGERAFPAMGHLFTPREIGGLIAGSGLTVRKRLAVDYETGERSDLPWRGQLVFMIGRQAA
jgi:SAM-dependent methyltransferase